MIFRLIRLLGVGRVCGIGSGLMECGVLVLIVIVLLVVSVVGFSLVRVLVVWLLSVGVVVMLLWMLMM